MIIVSLRTTTYRTERPFFREINIKYSYINFRQFLKVRIIIVWVIQIRSARNTYDIFSWMQCKKKEILFLWVIIKKNSTGRKHLDFASHLGKALVKNCILELKDKYFMEPLFFVSKCTWSENTLNVHLFSPRFQKEFYTSGLLHMIEFFSKLKASSFHLGLIRKIVH